MDPFFKNPDTNAKYEATVTKDRTIHLPGKYSGKLSNITPEVAEAMVAMEDNQVKARKKPLPAPVPPAGDPK